MKIAFGFPTLNRPDGCTATKEAAVDAGFRIIIDQQEQMPRAWTACMHQLIKFAFTEVEADVFVQASDCCRFQPGARAAIETCFADRLDRVAGCNVINMPSKPDVLEYSFLAIGRDFAERFPDWQLYCPDYWHFYADTELGLYAKETGKYVFSEGAKIELVHPNTGAPKDYTYRMSRVFYREDTLIWRARGERGLLWGRDFELLEQHPGFVESLQA